MAKARKKTSSKSARENARSKNQSAEVPPETTGSPYRLRDEVVERALFTDEYSGLLEDYFGEEGFQELKALQREASATRSAGRGRRVLILPGILGSKIGTERAIFDDVLWIDPLDIARGKLAKLALGPGATRHKVLGVFLVAYLKLKLRLKIAGFQRGFLGLRLAAELGSIGQTVSRPREAGAGRRDAGDT